MTVCAPVFRFAVAHGSYCPPGTRAACPRAACDVGLGVLAVRDVTNHAFRELARLGRREGIGGPERFLPAAVHNA